MSAEWVRVDLDVVEKYGADAGVVLGLIAYRCNLTGSWQASMVDLIHESRLTEHRVKSALRLLRDCGAVDSRRADRFHPTLTWSVSPGHAVNEESSVTRMGESPAPVMEESSVTSSIEATEELPLLVPTPAPAEKPTKKPRRATQLPPGFGPTQAHRELAASLGVDLRVEGPQFVDHHTAKGSTFKNWDAALNTWIRNAAKYAERSNVRPFGRPAAAIASPDEEYDPAHAATLPPAPKRDLYA